MSITERDYQYTIVPSESLAKIAEKHGMTPTKEGARKIWEDSRNDAMRSTANMYGTTVNRQLHLGNSEYRAYSHSSDWQPGERAYDDPRQIIIYSGETIWIPPEDSAEAAEAADSSGSSTSIWAIEDETYLVTQNRTFFNYDKYLHRVREQHSNPGWYWHGIGATGQYLPYVTNSTDVELWPVKPGTRFKVKKILYQAHRQSTGKAFQAVEPEFDVENSEASYTSSESSKLSTKGFMWIVYDDNICFEDAPEIDEEPDEDLPVMTHVLTDDELLNGWVPTSYDYLWELVFPVFRVRINKVEIDHFATEDILEDEDYRLDLLNSEDAVFKLIGKYDSDEVAITRTVELKNAINNSEEEDQIVNIDFQGVLRGDNVRYTVEVYPGKDPDGNEREMYVLVEGVTFTEWDESDE